MSVTCKPVFTVDNNAADRALKPFVIGRKEWQFSGRSKDATASAHIYNLVETAKANDQEPYSCATYWSDCRMQKHCCRETCVPETPR